MKLPELIVADCYRNISSCVDALQAAEELDRMGLGDKAEIYRSRAVRHADKVRRLLETFAGQDGVEPGALQFGNDVTFFESAKRITPS